MLNFLSDQLERPDSTEELMIHLYDELRVLAANWLANENPGQTLQPTALVHEAWLRLEDGSTQSGCRWENKGHFFAAAARTMRRILVDNARRKKRPKHGGDLQRGFLESAQIEVRSSDLDVLDLEEALSDFEKEHPKQAQVLQLKFFAQLSFEEIAEFTGISERTAKRYWRFARTWLHQRLNR